MKRGKWILAVLFFVLFATDASAKIYLDVYGKAYKKVTIAVPYFKAEGASNLQTDMTQLLHKDLDFSGFFTLAPLSLMDRELNDEGITKAEVRFANWRSIGVELLCKGKVLQTVDGNVSFDAYLYDVLDGSILLAKRYRGRTDEWKQIIHRFADDIVLAVTGERGIMSSRVVFVGGVRNRREIYTAGLAGDDVQKITSYRNITMLPSVSPNGKYLLYTSYREGRPNLYVMDLATKRDVFADRDEGAKIGSWKNGNTIVYSQTIGKDSTIYLVDVEKKSKQVLFRQPGIVTSPSFSPDGTKLVYVSDMYGGPQIFLRDMLSGDSRRLTYSGNYNTAPSFSPKGNFITFVSNIGGSFEICVMNADGSDQKILTNGGFNESPQFSPCGRYIIYHAKTGGQESINLMFYNGDNKRRLKFTDGNEAQGRFLP
jgi:TolB protein